MEFHARSMRPNTYGPAPTATSSYVGYQLHGSSQTTEEEYEDVLNATVPLQYTTYSQSVPFTPTHESLRFGRHVKGPLPGIQSVESSPTGARKKIHWVTPYAAVVLFLVGLLAAIGHCVFFSIIKEQPVDHQTWTFRYSLALAFVFKSSLAASVSIALAQHVWLMLRHNKSGTLIEVIDAMLSSQSSLLSFLSPTLWRSAVSTATIAACIWLMPLTALVAPTALTVGTSLVNSTESCVVPTLDWSANRILSPDFPTKKHALFETTDQGDLYIKPSTDSERLTGSVLENGKQIGWTSPCGLNCAYEIDFIGPSWRCEQTDYDDPDVPWLKDLSWSGIYAQIYYGGLDASANKFWTGFAAKTAESLISRDSNDRVQAYYCQVANTSYSMQVNYNNGIQTNTLLHLNPFATFEISKEGWKGEGSYSEPGKKYEQEVPPPLQDVIGMYMPMINMLSGSIMRYPQYGLAFNTSLGLVPTLITNLPSDLEYASPTQYIPREDLGPLLEELSQNLTISLMSNPLLLVTNSSTVPCHRFDTITVWKVDWLPIIVAYTTGLAITLICLAVGAHALKTNGVVHDTSFSSILRTTRNDGLSRLVDYQDVGALPLSQEMKSQRLRFTNQSNHEFDDDDATKVRLGFVISS